MRMRWQYADRVILISPHWSMEHPIPEIHCVDENNGLLLLEDCGDETLEKHISEKETPYNCH